VLKIEWSRLTTVGCSYWDCPDEQPTYRPQPSWRHHLRCTVQDTHTASFLLILSLSYKQVWLQFLSNTKATAFKQEIPKFYPQTQRTDAIAITSNVIQLQPYRPAINAKVSTCASNSMIKFWLLFLQRRRCVSGCLIATISTACIAAVFLVI